MKAIVYQKIAAASKDDYSLQAVTLPKPKAQGYDLLVRVEAISVNPVDNKVRVRTKNSGAQAQVLGWDAAGVVEAMGDQVTGFAVGDPVWYAGAIDRAGSCAQFQLVDARIVARMPDSLNFAEAAAMPLTTITAWELLCDGFGLHAESQGNLLIIGAAGGVGSMLIQLAKRLTKLRVIATASRAQSEQWVKQLGADVVINHHHPLKPQLEALGITEMSYIASLTHSDTYAVQYVELIAPYGKIGLIDDPVQFDIVPFKRKCVSFYWEFMFARSLYQTADMQMQQQLLTQVAHWVDQGLIQTTMTQHMGTITPANVQLALDCLSLGNTCGKMVLEGF